MPSARRYCAQVLLPLAAWYAALSGAALVGCSSATSPGNGEARNSRLSASLLPAPRRLELAADRKPLPALAFAAPTELAHVAAVGAAESLPARSGPRIVEISGTPSALSAGLIHEPVDSARAQQSLRASTGTNPPSPRASGKPTPSRYSEVARIGDSPSHVTPDSVPHLAERPRYDDYMPPEPAVTPAADQPQTPIVPAPPAELAAAPAAELPYASQPRFEQRRIAQPPVYHQLPAPAADPARAAANAAAMQAVADRAGEISNRGYALAQRGMFYAARAELIQALQLVAQARDVQTATAEHSTALAAGLTAMKEATDFSTAASRGSDVANVAAIAGAHRTPVLKAVAAADLSPVVAQQQYLAYAQSQLIVAAGGQPVASHTLYRLGRVQTALAPLDGQQQSNSLAGPQAMVFQQAALGVDSRNYLAANELGVLLARYGQWADARRLLLQSVSQHPHAEGWSNLAVVHRKLGEDDLARRAEHERTLVTQGAGAPAKGDPLIRWVDTRTFASASPGDVPWPTAPTASQPQTAVRGSVSAGVTR